MKRTRLMTLCGSALVALASHVCTAQGLGAASYRASIVTPEGSNDSDFIPVPVSLSFSYSGVDFQGNPYSYTARSSAGGGRVPIADIDAAGSGSVGGFATGPVAESRVLYGFRVMPRAGSTRTTVPLVITVLGDAQITSTGPFTRAFALAESIVRRPGTSSILVAGVASVQYDSVVMNPTDAFNQTISTVVSVGSTGMVELRARGEIFINAEITATADPIMFVDPDATYEENGQTFFYADEFEIEYSETIVQWTPCPADLNDDGELNFFDVSAFLMAYNAKDFVVDYTGDGEFDFFDVSAFLGYFGSGCP